MTRETRVLDYSFARPGPREIVADGYVGVLRYIGAGSRTKLLSKPELRDLHAAGLSVGVVFEGAADRAKDGRAAGVEDAKAACVAADALGIPKQVPIFFAVDFDASPDQIAAYFDGVVSYVPNRAGIYGGFAVMGLPVPWRWQTAAWSGGKLHPKTHILQRATPLGAMPAGCDQNVVCRAISFFGPKGVVVLRPSVAKEQTPTRAPTPGVVKKPGTRGRNVDAAVKAAARAETANRTHPHRLNVIRHALAWLRKLPRH